jgi:hypothetical protein
MRLEKGWFMVSKSMSEIILKRFGKFVSGDMSLLMDQQGDIVIKDIIGHIENQEAIDGSPLKMNAYSTIRRKVMQGKEPLSLIDDKRLIKPEAFVKEVGKAKCRISRNKSMPGLRKKGSRDYSCIGAILIDKGYNFWGISVDAVDKMAKNIKKYVIALIKSEA